jgi:hypothetical protein
LVNNDQARENPGVRHRLFNFAAAVSLVLCLTTAGLWVTHRPVVFTSSRESGLYIGCDDGFVVSVSKVLADPRPSFSVSDSNPAALYAWINSMQRRRSIVGFEFGRQYAFISGGGHMQLYATAMVCDDGVKIPAWFIVLLTAILPLWWVRTIRHKSKGPGCLVCGYNLTGNTSGVCPECGTPVPKEAAEKRPRTA